MDADDKHAAMVWDAENAFAAADDLAALERIKSQHIGRASQIGSMINAIRTLPAPEKRLHAALLNVAKARIEKAYAQRRLSLQEKITLSQLQEQTIDVTLPGRGRSNKGLHPLSRSLQRIEECFSSLGFDTAEGPELETSFYNFTALNMPDNHPARSMHDTFYLDMPGVQLRTHTSPIQARYMRQCAHRQTAGRTMPDIKIICPGRAYRVDSDATHSPMFHQIEGLWISQSCSFSNLKWIIEAFLKAFFEAERLETRFRPSFFPFTEPSAEIDLAFQNGPSKGKWLEVGGCGMVHPKVLSMGGIDPETYVGFAFGMGVDRLTMLRYGVDDLRSFYEGDLRFLRQFL